MEPEVDSVGKNSTISKEKSPVNPESTGDQVLAAVAAALSSEEIRQLNNTEESETRNEEELPCASEAIEEVEPTTWEAEKSPISDPETKEESAEPIMKNDCDTEVKSHVKQDSHKESPGAPEKNKHEDATEKVSVFDYLYGEIRRGYMLENDEQRFTERRERFYIFIKIPKEIEKFILYGFFQCVDAFLFLFTFLPLRFLLAVWFLITRSLKLAFSTVFGTLHKTAISRILQPAEICDLLKGIILITVCFMMSYVDTSMMYHIVKSQSVIKLYIMFNMLEVADKLFSSFGQDILDALYWTATEPRGKKREHIGLLPHLLVGIAYVFLHCIIVLFQATTLNVAINSQNKGLLTIMMSNNFVELKSMVFKKFEKNNLFQMSCSDVRERFHYLVLLFIVIIQTMKEYNWSEDQFWVLLPYCFAVFGAEMLVDWVKHAFITRFNEIPYEVYKDYTISLAYDLASCKLKNAFSDHSDLISRRMGFIPLPLGALVLRIVIGSVSVVGYIGILSLFLLYLCLISAKVLSSIILLGKACDEIEFHRNSQKEKLPQPRQCNSLPSSRHHSTENIPHAVETKSMPQSHSASMSSSLADIATQAEILQETMDPNPMFSNSTVSLNSLGMNDNVFTSDQFALNKHETGTRWKASSTFGGKLRPPPNEPLKRRISLQEKVEFSDDLKN